MEIVSGILLACVVLGIAGFLVNEAVGDKVGAALRRSAQSSPSESQNSLLGQLARVIANDDDADYARVRVGTEGWNAISKDGEKLLVDTEVKIVGVNGFVLDVEVHVEEHVEEHESTPQTPGEEAETSTTAGRQ